MYTPYYVARVLQQFTLRVCPLSKTVPMMCEGLAITNVAS